MQTTMEIDRYEDVTLASTEGYKYSDRVYLNPQDNGGESIFFIIDRFDNGDGEEFTWTRIQTTCYGVTSTETRLHNVDPFELAHAILSIR